MSRSLEDILSDPRTKTLNKARKITGEVGSVRDGSKYFKNMNFLEMVDHRFILFGPRKEKEPPYYTYIHIDLPKEKAAKIGKAFYKALAGKRSYDYTMVYLHDYPVIIGTNDGEISIFQPPSKKPKKKKTDPRDVLIQKMETIIDNSDFGRLDIKKGRGKQKIVLYSPKTENRLRRPIRLTVTVDQLEDLIFRLLAM